jgi:hypothetical protein
LLGRSGFSVDLPLYAIAIAAFALLYIGIGVFLLFTLIITLLVMLIYVIVRYSPLPDGYPYSANAITQTVILVGVTWAVFVWVSDKNPIPFLGNGLTYVSPDSVAIGPILIISLVVLLAFLVIMSFAMPELLRNRQGGGGSGGGDEKPKQGVGA